MSKLASGALTVVHAASAFTQGATAKAKRSQVKGLPNGADATLLQTQHSGVVRLRSPRSRQVPVVVNYEVLPFEPQAPALAPRNCCSDPSRPTHPCQRAAADTVCPANRKQLAECGEISAREDSPWYESCSNCSTARCLAPSSPSMRST